MGAKIDRAPSTTVVLELVERCRYVTGGMEFELAPLPSTTDVSFAYNTATPFVTLHSVLVRLSNELRRRDDGGSEDRSCIIDNSCSEVVERCRYVTGGMEFDLAPL